MYKQIKKFFLAEDEPVSPSEDKPKKVRKLRQNEIFQMPKKEKKMTPLEKKFKEHAKHHSKEHIAFMKKEMKEMTQTLGLGNAYKVSAQYIQVPHL